MFHPKNIYLWLFPLVILLCLSCPVKQEIKHTLDIPIETKADTAKSADFKSCITTFSQNETLQKVDKQNSENDYLFTLVPNGQSNTHISHTIGDSSSLEEVLSVPLFIIHRKIII